MRNKYSEKFEKDMIRLATDNSLDGLLKVAKSKYKYNITKKQLRLYLSKRKIRYKDFDYARSERTRNLGDYYPIGYEYTKDDGMVLVKIAKDKYMYKQRYIYEQYYNVKLTSDDYIIFLDQDRTNFNIDNLKRINRRESSIVANQKLFFNKPELTKTGIEIAKLMIKVKEKSKNEKRTNKQAF